MRIIKKNEGKPKKKMDFLGVQAQRGKWYTIQEVSQLLGKTDQTIINWCKEGRLPCTPIEYGTKLSYRIPREAAIAAFEVLKGQKRQKIYKEEVKVKTVHNHYQLLEVWDRFCEQGLMGGRPYSPSTRKVNKYFLEKFLAKWKEVAPYSLKAELLELPIEQFGKREKIWMVCLNFYRFLVKEEMGDPKELERIRALKPRRYSPARRLSISEDQIKMLEDHCQNLFQKTIVVLLSQTGLRSSEFCGLKKENLDLVNRKLMIVGKGGKYREIGLNLKAYETLVEYLKENEPHSVTGHLFLDRLGNPLVKDGLSSRLRKIGKRAGIEVHPHAMRRSFVTVNANKGRSLVTLQILCGHSDIGTTRTYCQTSMQDAVAQIRDWD